MTLCVLCLLFFPLLPLLIERIQTMIPGWQIVARAPDGLIEAIEYKYHPWMVAIQWHPEMSPKSLPNCGIFQAFVEAAASKFINYTKSA